MKPLAFGQEQEAHRTHGKRGTGELQGVPEIDQDEEMHIGSL